MNPRYTGLHQRPDFKCSEIKSFDYRTACFSTGYNEIPYTFYYCTTSYVGKE